MYQRILVAIDGSDTANLGLEQAIALARLSGGRLRLLHVLDGLGHACGFESAAVYGAEVLPRARSQGKAILQNGAERARRAGVEVDTVLVETVGGRVCDCVVAAAKSWDAALIVLGTHGRRGADRFFMGSDAEQVLRLAPVPVLLVRAAVAAWDPSAEPTPARSAVSATQRPVAA